MSNAPKKRAPFTGNKSMSMRELEKSEDLSVFCLNVTEGVNRSQILFSVPSPMGTADTVIVPVTWIPVELTALVSKEQLMAASAFRRAISNGLIALITPEYAEYLMQDDMAKHEADRMRGENIKFRASVSEVEHGLASVEHGTQDVTVFDIDNGTDNVDTVQTEGGASPVVIQALENLNNDGQELAAMLTIRNIGKLSGSDRGFLLDNVPAKYEELRAMLETM